MLTISTDPPLSTSKQTSKLKITLTSSNLQSQSCPTPRFNQSIMHASVGVGESKKVYKTNAKPQTTITPSYSNRSRTQKGILRRKLIRDKLRTSLPLKRHALCRHRWRHHTLGHRRSRPSLPFYLHYHLSSWIALRSRPREALAAIQPRRRTTRDRGLCPRPLALPLVLLSNGVNTRAPLASNAHALLRYTGQRLVRHIRRHRIIPAHHAVSVHRVHAACRRKRPLAARPRPRERIRALHRVEVAVGAVLALAVVVGRGRHDGALHGDVA